MPHRCMNCGKTYEDDSEELINGCECGSSLFMYEQEDELSQEELEEERDLVKSDIEEMVAKGETENSNIRIEFDLDSIKVKEEGVYSINVSRLLEEIPLVIEKREGVYHIHLPSAFTPGKREFNVEDL
ncbi:MAG: Zn-ribbon domain-containing protein [Candidatus Nanohaloarchaea archaeon]